MIKKIHHIAIAVRDAEKAAEFYSKQLGIPVERVEEVPYDKVRVAILPLGESEIELVEPLDPEGGVASFIERRGEGLHHICLEVDDIKAELAGLAEKGVELIDKEPRKGAVGLVAFIHPRASGGVLLELNQPE